MVGFHGDALCLSGITGTRLKSEILSRYYRFWWNITSGGDRQNHKNPTAIIELNAGTGEIFIEDTSETIFGSAGHALQMKFELDHRNTLKIILVENDQDCYYHLKNVLKRQFPEFPIDNMEGPFENNSTNIYLFNMSLGQALEKIDSIENLGNALYFFDPLRMVEWRVIEQVARSRIRKYYATRTEFIIFLFTSDYFLGRKEFAPFPNHNYETKWTPDEISSVREADALFGDPKWRETILNDRIIMDREREFIDLYKENLHKWFRYVIALPFNPKKNQIYHLIYCSNYEAGIRATKNNFLSLTRQPKFNPDNKSTYSRFIFLFPELGKTISGKQRPLEWKILWALIMQEDGIRDRLCPDLRNIHSDSMVIQRGFDWLLDHNFLERIEIDCAIYAAIPKYRLNWPVLMERLKIPMPPEIQPLSNEEIHAEIIEQKKQQATLFDGF